MAIVVDTAALAAHLGCRPSYVRVLVHRESITPIGRWSRTGRGRPTMWFDVDQVDKQLGRVEADELDQVPVMLRK